QRNPQESTRIHKQVKSGAVFAKLASRDIDGQRSWICHPATCRDRQRQSAAMHAKAMDEGEASFTGALCRRKYVIERGANRSSGCSGRQAETARSALWQRDERTVNKPSRRAVHWCSIGSKVSCTDAGMPMCRWRRGIGVAENCDKK